MSYTIVMLDAVVRADGSIVGTTRNTDVREVSETSPMPKTAEDVSGCTKDIIQAMLDGNVIAGQKLSIVARGGAGCAVLHDWTEHFMIPRALRGIVAWAKNFAPRLFNADESPVPHLALNTALRDLMAPREPGKKDTQSGVMESSDFLTTAVSEMAELAIFVKNGSVNELVRPVLPAELRGYQDTLDAELVKAAGQVWHIRPGFVHDIPVTLYALPGMSEIDGRPAFTPTEPWCGALDSLYTFRLQVPPALRGKMVSQDTEGMERGGSWSHLNRPRHVNIPTWDRHGAPCVVSLQVGLDGLVVTGEPILVHPDDLTAVYTNKARLVLEAMLKQLPV